MNRNWIIIAAAASVFAVLIVVLLLLLPEQPESTTATVTATVQDLPAGTEATDTSPAKPEEPAQPIASAEPTVAPEPAPEPKPAGVIEIVPPSFDIVRVEATGETVLAGRAMAGSEVSVLDGGALLGKVAVDGRGQWAFVVATPLAPGSHELSLESRLSDGRVVTSTDVVVINVPQPKIAAAPQATPQQTAASAVATESASAASAPESAQAVASTANATRIAGTGTTLSPKITVSEQPLVVLMPRSGQGPSQVLQQSTSPTSGLAEGTLVLETIDYDELGAVIGGRAEPGARLIVYLDNSVLGKTVAGLDGRWSLVLDRPLAIGLHRMRVDVLDAKGMVTASVETPFARVVLVEMLPDETSVVVQPGNSLWRIARRVYGKGVRYTVIYEANQAQIRDADLIYPGQVFKVPMTAPAAN